jgi:integrase
LIQLHGGLDKFKEAYTHKADMADTFRDIAETFSNVQPHPSHSIERQAATVLTSYRAREAAPAYEQDARDARNTLKRITGESEMGGAIAKWIEAAKPSDEYARKMKLYGTRFVACVGDKAPSAVTRADAMKFRDAIAADVEAGKLKRSAAAKPLEHLHTLFAWVVSNDADGVNPFSGVKLPKVREKFSEQEGKKPFQPEHVRQIFDVMDSTQQSDDFKWIVRLCAFHGCRSGEAAQLRVEDVRMEFGMPVLRLTDANDAQRLKNRFSFRTVPLHPECAGFLEYAKAKGSGPVFTSLKVYRGTRAADFQKRFSEFLRKQVKITDPDLTGHSFRHGWRTLARNLSPVPMPGEIVCAIGGWSPGKGEQAARSSARRHHTGEQSGLGSSRTWREDFARARNRV